MEARRIALRLDLLDFADISDLSPLDALDALDLTSDALDLPSVVSSIVSTFLINLIFPPARGALPRLLAASFSVFSSLDLDFRAPLRDLERERCRFCFCKVDRRDLLARSPVGASSTPRGESSSSSTSVFK